MLIIDGEKMNLIRKTILGLGAVFAIGTLSILKAAMNEPLSIERPQYYLATEETRFGMGHGGIMAFPSSPGHTFTPMGHGGIGRFSPPALQHPLPRSGPIERSPAFDLQREKNEILNRQQEEREMLGLPLE